jgi:hypothetical protein
MPKSSAWQILTNYESQDLVRRQFRVANNREINAEHAREIRSAVTQAREYFEAASTAGRAVKPLLLYYGVLGLSRAVIMFMSGLREAALSQGHGLSPSDWQSVFSKTELDPGALEVQINKNGSLRQFAEATGNRSYLTDNSSRANIDYIHKAVPEEANVRIDDLLSRLPEIGAHYVRWRGLPNFCELHSIEAKSDGADIRIPKKLYELELPHEFASQFFGDRTHTFQSDHDSVIWYKAPKEFAELPQFWDHRNRSFGKIGDLVFIKDFPTHGQFSKPVATFILAYAFGMYARYYPARWMALTRNEVGDACLPSFLAALDFVEEWFPIMVLEFLEPPTK